MRGGCNHSETGENQAPMTPTLLGSQMTDLRTSPASPFSLPHVRTRLSQLQSQCLHLGDSYVRSGNLMPMEKTVVATPQGRADLGI